MDEMSYYVKIANNSKKSEINCEFQRALVFSFVDYPE